MPEADVVIVEDGPPEPIEVVDDLGDSTAAGEPLVALGGEADGDGRDFGETAAVRAAEGRWSEADRPGVVEALEDVFGAEGYENGVVGLDVALGEIGEVPTAILEQIGGAEAEGDDASSTELTTWLADAGSWLRSGREVPEPAPLSAADVTGIRETFARAGIGAFEYLDEAWGPYLADNLKFVDAAVAALGMPKDLVRTVARDAEGFAELIALGSLIGRRLVHGPAHYVPEFDGGRNMASNVKRVPRSDVDRQMDDLTVRLHKARAEGNVGEMNRLNRERATLADAAYGTEKVPGAW